MTEGQHEFEPIHKASQCGRCGLLWGHPSHLSGVVGVVHGAPVLVDDGGHRPDCPARDAEAPLLPLLAEHVATCQCMCHGGARINLAHACCICGDQ